MSIQNKAMPAPPQTLAQLLGLMLRGMLKGLLIRLPLALGAGFFVWVLHTYLLVGPNEGFAPGPYQILHSILALRDRILTGTTFWTLLTMFGSMLLFSFFRGPGKFFKSIISTPAWIGKSLQSSGVIGPSLLLSFGALAVVAGTMLENRLISLLLSLVLLGSLVAQQSSFMVVLLSLAWSDVQRLLRSSRPIRRFEPYWAGAGLTGVIIGFFLAAILPFAPYCGCTSALLLLGAMVAWIFYKRRTPTIGTVVLLLALFIGLMLPLTTVVADDGGWLESGSSLTGWLTSEGALIAIALGLPPSIGAALGVLLGSSISTLIPPSLVDGLVSQGLTSIQMENLRNRVNEIIQQRIKEGFFVRNPDLFRKMWNNTLGRGVEWIGGWKGGQCGEFGEWGQKWSKDAVREIFGNGAVMTDITAYRNYFVNHNATRVILPNGDRIVIDYWEGIQTGQPKIYSEQEWIGKWKNELGGTPDILRQSSPLEFDLNTMINQFGEEKGIQFFRKTYKNQPDKAEAIIRSFKKDPWPTK